MSMTEDIVDFVVSFGLNAAPADLLPRVRVAYLDYFLRRRICMPRLQMRRWLTVSRHIPWTMIISATRAR